MNLVVDGRGYSGAPSTVDELSADVVREIATTLRVVNTKVKESVCSSARQRQALKRKEILSKVESMIICESGMRPTRVRARPRPGGARAAESALPEVLAMHRRAKRTLALRAPWRTFPGPWPGVVGDMFGGKTPTPAKVRPSAHSPFRRARPLDASRARRRCRREECDAIAALRASRPSSLRFRDLLPVSPPLSQGDVDRAAARKLAQKEAELEMLQVANEALQAQAKMAVEREEATKEVASRHQEALEEARERIDDLEGKLRDATRSGDAPASSASASASSSVPPAGEQGKDAVVELQKKLQVAAAMVKKLRASEKALEERLAAACLLYTSPSPRDATLSRMPSSA